MGLFNLIKKIFQEEQKKEKEVKILTFSEVGVWADYEKKEAEAKEKEIISTTNKRIETLDQEIKEKIAVLKDYNVEEKKEKEEIKNVVNLGREKYITFVEELLNNLTELKDPRLENYLEIINKKIYSFNKSSHKNYQKATILIGKEMASIKNSIKNFSLEIYKIFDKNKSLIYSLKQFPEIKNKWNAINSINKDLKEIDEKVLDLNEKKDSKEKEYKKLQELLQKTKSSPSYLERIEKEKQISDFKEQIKKDVFDLGQLIDFKALAAFFRINPEQMKMVKNHRENFSENFNKDEGKIILDLLNEAKLNKNTISERVDQIRTNLSKLKGLTENVGEDPTAQINSQIENFNEELDSLKDEKAKEEKRQEKLRSQKEELRESLKNILAELGATLETA